MTAFQQLQHAIRFGASWRQVTGVSPAHRAFDTRSELATVSPIRYNVT